MNRIRISQRILLLSILSLLSVSAYAWYNPTYTYSATVQAGLSNSSTGGGYVYVDNEATGYITVSDSNWRPNSQYDGSEGGNSSNTENAYVNVYLYAKENPGYQFDGWTIDSQSGTPGDKGTKNGSVWSSVRQFQVGNNDYGPLYSHPYRDKEYTAYAFFSPIPYKIEYAPGLKGSGSMVDTPYTIKSTGSVPSASFTAANGYEFDKWRVDACDSNGYWPAVGSTVNSGTSLTGNIGNLSLTALWKLVDYTISFSANGGTGTNPADIHYNVESSSFSLPACPYTKSGYVFAGWKPSANSGSWNTSQLFAGGASIPTGQYGNVTLVAQWESLASITISVTGLKTGESAMFNLRKNDAYGDILYTVVLTSDNSSVTIKNLETGVQYYAQPVSAWNWYTMSPTSSSHTLDSDGYTFSFTATAKDKKHDETYNANWKQ